MSWKAYMPIDKFVSKVSIFYRILQHVDARCASPQQHLPCGIHSLLLVPWMPRSGKYLTTTSVYNTHSERQ